MPILIPAKLLAIILAVALAQSAAAGEEFIHCNHIEREPLAGGERKVFYSAVFLADYSDARQFKRGFSKYVRDELGGKAGETYCFFGRDESSAQREQARKISHEQRIGLYDDFAMTGWRPDGADNSPLRDFHISVCNPADTAEICVNDHACEDGDEIRVSFDGRQIFSGEIFNKWDCSEVGVNAGSTYALDLLALNETGGKGGCPNQVNTGAMKISSATTQTQEWRHRGKTGSAARLIVTLDDTGVCGQSPAAPSAPSQSGGGGASSGGGANSCKYANDGECDESGLCDVGTDTNDCRPSPAPASSDSGASATPAPSGSVRPAPSPAASGGNLCEFANDGECDEPHFCDPGTDGNDCN